MILLETELEELKLKRSENIHSAYVNIINSDAESYKNELEIVLRYYGIKYSIKETRLEAQLNEIKNKFNISCRALTLGDKWYTNNMLPLLIKRGGEFKAVLPSFNGRCSYCDGYRNIRITDKNAGDFDNKAFCFYRGFEKENLSRLSVIKYMLKCITPSQYVVLTASMTAVTLFSTVMPQAQYYIFEHMIPKGTKGDVLPVVCLLFGIILISLVMYIYKGIVAVNIPLCINANLQGAVIARLLKLKAEFFASQRSGSLSSAITDVSRLSALFSPESTTAFMSFVLSVVYAVQIKIFAGEFLSFLYIAFAVVAVLTFLNAFFINRYKAKLSNKTDDMTGFVYEMFSGMEDIKLNNADTTMFKRWSDFYSQTLKAQKKPMFTKYYAGVYTIVISIFTLFIFRIGINTDASTAEFIVFMSLYGLFIGSVGGIDIVFNAAAEFNSAYERLKDFFKANTEEAENKRNIYDFKGNIEFSNVSFKYPGSDRYILENISLSIKKGQKVGITGRSGSGKSTLIKLLLGFEQPQIGRIFIDNMDLNEVNLLNYRKRLGVVLQNSKLIPADIFLNITFADPYASYDDVIKVIEEVGLKDDIEKMPMGLYTFVSDDNLTISAGQKQRILLARALLKKPHLLVLDEATNALDNVTQAAVTQYLENLETTAVIIAHRLSTIKKCDNIIVIDGGKIAEQGKYDDLIQRRGIFYDLVKNQML